MKLNDIIQHANEALADGSLARLLNVEQHYAAMLVDAAIESERRRQRAYRAKQLGHLFGPTAAMIYEETRDRIAAARRRKRSVPDVVEEMAEWPSELQPGQTWNFVVQHTVGDVAIVPNNNRHDQLSEIEALLRRLGH